MDSFTTLLWRSPQDEGSLDGVFTYLGPNGCTAPISGHMKRTMDDAATFEANFTVYAGHFRILYVDDDYSHSLFHTCVQPNEANDSCQMVVVEVASRSNRLSTDKMDDLMGRARDVVCVEPSDFALLKHEVRCPLSVCKVENAAVQPGLNWTEFAGNWFIVYRLKGKFSADSGMWKLSRPVNEKVYATYVASRYGKCLTPIRAVWTPKVDKPGEYVVSFGGFNAGIGKILQTDYQSSTALYYGCLEHDSDGNCVASNVHVEEWRRGTEAVTNVTSLSDELLRSLCINNKTVEDINHNVLCNVPAQCKIPDAALMTQTDFSKLLGNWKMLTVLGSGKDFEGRGTMNEVAFNSVGGLNDTIIVCFTSTNRQNACQTTECRTFETLFTSGNHHQTKVDSRQKHSTKWKLVYVGSNHLGIYVCRKVDDWEGTRSCDSSAGVLYVLERADRAAQNTNLESELERLLDGTCLSWSHQKNLTVSCPVEVPSYSRIISKLPRVTVSLPQFMGVWYSASITGNHPFESVSKIRLLPNARGKVDVIITKSTNGTCQPSERYLATAADESGVDWIILLPDRRYGHLRFLYADHDVAVVYFCRALSMRGVCAPNEGELLLLSRTPSLNDEKAVSVRESLHSHGHNSIDDIARKAGFESNIGWNISFDGAAGCSLQTDENLCPIESLPVLKKLLVNKFLGKWFLVSRLKNSPSFDSAELRLTPGKEISVVYRGTKNGKCQKPLAGRLIPLPNGFESQFEFDYGNGQYGRFQVVFTNYRTALVYQCLQLLSDGSCLPGQVAVELLSRTKEMIAQDLKVPLIIRTQDLCVNQSEMVDTSYDVDCEEDPSARCFIEDFPKDTSFSSSDLVGTWFVRYVNSDIQHLGIPSKIEILRTDDEGQMRYISHFSDKGLCYTTESDLLSLSSVKSFQLVFDFKENNKIIRIIETGYGLMLMYICKFVGTDGKCRPGFGGVLVLSQTQDHITEEIVIHYGDLLPELCLESSGELVKFQQPDCKSVDAALLMPSCDPTFTEIPIHYAQRMTGVVWHLAGWIGGKEPRIAIKYYAAKDSDSEDITIHFTDVIDGKCVPTSKKFAKYDSDGFYEAEQHSKHEEFVVLFSDDDVIVIYFCLGYDSVGRCEPEDTVVGVYTKNSTLPQLAEEKLRNSSTVFDWCFSVEDFQANESPDCPLVVEPECTISVPPMRMILDLEKLEGYWFAIMSRTDRNTPHITAIEIELSADRKTLTTFLATSHNGRCLPTIKTVAVKESEDGFRWKFRTLSLPGYLLLLHVDDDHLILLECTSDEPCSPETASAIDVFGRAKAYFDNADREKVAKLLRRICHSMDNFTLLINDLECVVELRPQTSECIFDYRNRQLKVDFRQMTGSWYAVAKSKRSDLPETEMLRISSSGPTSATNFSLTVINSRRGECLSPAEGRLEPVVDKIPGRIRTMYKDSFIEFVVLFTDYRYLVDLECRDIGVNDSCNLQNGYIAMYARDPVDVTSIIPDLIRIVRLEDCFQANDFVSVSHDVSCILPPSSCFLDPSIPVPDNFTTDMLIGVWYSLYQLRSASTRDSYTIRFHEDDESGSVVAYFVFSRHRECQSPAKFTIPEDSHEWQTVVENKQTLMKVLAFDADHVILYQCLDHRPGQGECHPDVTWIDVLGRSSSEESSPELFSWVVASLKQSCVEVGDMEHVRHSVSCRLPIIKRTVCQLDKMPVARNIDFNKFAGVWYSYYILQGVTPIDYSTKILQPTRMKTYSAIFRFSRKDECLSVQTATVVPRDDFSLHADFDAKFKSYTSRLRVLYTDYNYALIYTCTDEELAGGQCPSVHRHVAIYGRRKAGQIPEDVKERIFAAANEACVYEEDFVPATHVAECDIPYSGRHSCHLDHIITHDEFELREIFGSWQLLSHTTNRNSTLTAESIRFSPGSGGIIKYTVSGEDSLGLCQRLDETIEPVEDQNATFYFMADGRPIRLMKVLFMNSQYLVLYICHGSLPAGLKVCEEGQEEVKIFGRMSIMSLSARKMLVDIIWSRVCLGLESMVSIRHNSKCDLPSGCDIEDFLVEENFDPQKVAGTWQALIRSSFRLSSTLPSTANFAPSENNGFRVVRVLEQSGDICHFERLVMSPVEGLPGVYRTQYDEVENRSIAQTLFLYVTDRHFVTLDCFGALSSENECTTEKVELTVWGRNWDLGSEVRKTLLQRIQDKTLRCYAIHAMVDVKMNADCELPLDVCDMDDFALEKDFDGRMMLGQWHLISRSPLYKNLIRIGDMRMTLSGDTYHAVFAGKNGSECFQMNGSMKSTTEGNSTFMLTSDNIQTMTKVVYWSEEYLLRLDCVGVSSAVASCHPDRSGLQLLSRTGYMDEDTMSHLVRVMRERTQSCVKTHDLEPVPFAENICPHSSPAEGGEACSYDEIQLGHSLNLDQINGLWFQVLRSNRVGELFEDSVIHHLTVKGRTVEVIHAAYRGSVENGSCVLINEIAKISPRDSSQWSTLVDGQNDTIKMIYLDEDILVTYECLSNKFNSHRYCHHDFEHLQVLHRRRHINTVELRRIIDIVTKKTCFSQSELVMANHTRKCEVPGIIGLDYSIGKLCDVESYKTVADFDPHRFTGIWYESERTRFSGGKLWESGVFNFSLDSSGSLGFLYSGTVAGRCLGPIEGHTKLNQVDGASSDLILTIGPGGQNDHPWAIHYSLKILYTDYNSTAVIYSCHSVADDGRCHTASEQIFIMSRQPKLDDNVLERVYEVIRKSLCFDVLDFVRPAYEANCYDFISGEYVAQNRTALNGHHPGLTTQSSAEIPEGSSLPLATHPNCDNIPCSNSCSSVFVNGCEICGCRNGSTSSTTVVSNFVTELQVTHPPLKTDVAANVTSASDELCAIPMCQMHCPDGYARDEKGCETCDCVVSAQELKIEKENDFDPSMCAIPMCQMHCPDGYAKDEKGCETCDCIVPAEEWKIEKENDFDPSMCAIPMCQMHCPDGYAKDEKGCETCDCIVPAEGWKIEKENDFDPSMCAIPMCANYCPHGYAKDERGCETCNCALPTTAAQELKFKRDSDFDPMDCAIPMCFNRCEHGYALDERGCETCHCQIPKTDAAVTATHTDLVTNRRDDRVTIAPTEVVHKETPIPEEELETLVDEVDIPEIDSMIEEQRKTRNAKDLNSGQN